MMMMVMMMMVMMMILKGAEICNSLLTAKRAVFNAYTQVTGAQSCENHVQDVGRLSRATCCVLLSLKGHRRY